MTKPVVGPNLRSQVGERATEVVAGQIGADLIETTIPFEVENIEMGKGGLYADVRLGIVVRVPIDTLDNQPSLDFGDEKRESTFVPPM